jgi:hypothetical protein
MELTISKLNVIGRHNAIAIAGVKPGIAPNMIPKAVPAIISKIFPMDITSKAPVKKCMNIGIPPFYPRIPWGSIR